MSVTTLLNATAVPLPLAPYTPVQRNTITGTMGGTLGTLPTFAQNSTISSEDFNKFLNECANALIGAGNGSGIIIGLAITGAIGLNVTVTAGIAQGLGLVYMPANFNITCSDNATNYLWLLNNGTAQIVSGSLTPPSNACVYLGCAVMVSGSVTSLDNSGVCQIVSGGVVRTTNDALAPGDAPPASIRIQTITQNGTYLWDGVGHRQLLDTSRLSTTADGITVGGALDLTGHFISSTRTITISGTLALTNTDANNQIISCAADEHVDLPSNTGASFGQQFKITNANSGGGHNVLVYDSTDTTLLATITPGHMLTIPVVNSSGTPVWPTTGLTPAVSPTP